MITEQEFKEWKVHPVTKAVINLLEAKLAEGKDAWSKGYFQGETVEKTAILNAMAVGKAQALEGVVELDYEIFVGEND